MTVQWPWASLNAHFIPDKDNFSEREPYQSLIIHEQGKQTIADGYNEPLTTKPFDLMSRMFTNGLRDWGSIPGWVIQKTPKLVLDVALFNNYQKNINLNIIP